jgi:hypothetical protein
MEVFRTGRGREWSRRLNHGRIVFEEVERSLSVDLLTHLFGMFFVVAPDRKDATQRQVLPSSSHGKRLQ